MVFGEDVARSPPAGTYPYEPTTEVVLPKNTSFNRITFRIHSEKGKDRLCGVRIDSESGKYSDIQGFNDPKKTMKVEMTPSQAVVSAKIDTNGGNTPVSISVLICDFR